MKYLIYLLFIITFSLNASADIVGKAWTGDSDLYLDGDLYCSYDESKNPKILRRLHDGYFTTHRGGYGWIWPRISKDCAFRWLGYIPLQIRHGSLVAQDGNVVGAISPNKIEAKGFYNEPSDVFIKSLLIRSSDMENISIEIEFTHPSKSGLFRFVSTMKRHRDSVWP